MPFLLIFACDCPQLLRHGNADNGAYDTVVPAIVRGTGGMTVDPAGFGVTAADRGGAADAAVGALGLVPVPGAPWSCALPGPGLAGM